MNQDRPKIESLLGTRIASARLARGLNEEQLAHRLGVKASTIRNWEAERASPRASRLQQLSGVLDVPLLWLIAGAETPPAIDTPVLDETASLNSRINRAEALVNELSLLLSEIRADSRALQREFDVEVVDESVTAGN